MMSMNIREQREQKKLITEGPYKGLPVYFSDYSKNLLLSHLREVTSKVVINHRAGQKKFKFNSLVTVNFPEEFSSYVLSSKTCEKLNNLVQVVSDLKKLKWINSLQFCIEQRAQKKPFKGLHVHILINHSKYRKSYVLRSIYGKLTSKGVTHLLGKQCVQSKNSIDHRTCNGQDNYNGVLEYISGNKADEDKNDKVLCDEELRNSYGLKNLYCVG